MLFYISFFGGALPQPGGGGGGAPFGPIRTVNITIIFFLEISIDLLFHWYVGALKIPPPHQNQKIPNETIDEILNYRLCFWRDMSSLQVRNYRFVITGS